MLSQKTVNDKSPKTNKPIRKSVEQLTTDDLDQMVRLHELGYGTRKIALKLDITRSVVRSALLKLGFNKPANSDPPNKTSLLDPYRQSIQQKVEANLTTSRILREIKQDGYQGSRTILADFVRSLRPNLQPHRKVFCRFETPAGREMQVDWSPYKVPIAGTETVVHAFAMMSAFSRKEHIRMYPAENQNILLEAHVHGFNDFGGICQRIVYDRMSTVVLGTIGADRKPLWHPEFKDFAEHYGFEPYLCKPRDPNRKGKKEQFFSFFYRDCICACEFASMEDLNQRVRHWLDTVANVRVHGTTGLVPDEAFEEEKPLLIRLPGTHYPVGRREVRKVDNDAVLSVAGTRYNVPVHLANREVEIMLYAQHFEVLEPNGDIALSREYAPPEQKGRLILEPGLYEPLHKKDKTRPRMSAPKLEQAFMTRFPTLESLMTGIKLRMKSLSVVHLRALLKLADEYGEQAFVEIATRVQEAKRFDSHAVRRLLEREHPHNEPLPNPGLDAASRVAQQLGDVDPGSFEDYAYLDCEQETEHE